MTSVTVSGSMGAGGVMRLMMLVLAGCVAPIHVESNPVGAEVYITDYAPSTSMKPVSYEVAGTTPLRTTIDYLAWENYWVWVDADGYEPQIKKIPNEIKPGPAVGGFFCCIVWWAWALGPDDAPVYCELTQE